MAGTESGRGRSGARWERERINGAGLCGEDSGEWREGVWCNVTCPVQTGLQEEKRVLREQDQRGTSARLISGPGE